MADSVWQKLESESQRWIRLRPDVRERFSATRNQLGRLIKGFHLGAEITPNPSLSLRGGRKHYVIISVY